MRMRMAGVALAAVMACGWMGGAAEAAVAPIVIDFTISGSGLTFSGPNQAITPSDFPASGTTTIHQIRGGFVVDYFSLDIGSTHFDKTDFSDVTDFAQDGYNFDGFVLSGRNATQSQDIALDLHPNSANAVLSFNYHLYQKEGISCQMCVKATLVSGGLPSVVSLPTSAPLFGVALLALGAVGFGARRKKVAAAA